MSRPRLRAVCTAAAALAAATLLTAQAPPPLEIVTVAGRWVDGVEDGRAVVRSDPGGWDGATGPDLDAVARLLFKEPRPVFAKNSAPATAFPLAVVRSVEGFSGGALQVRFKLIAGPSDQTAGLAFAIGPTADYFYVRYNTKDGNVAVWEFVDGARRVLAHGTEHAQLPLNVWHRLSVRVDGRRVQGAVAGTSLAVAHELPREVSGRVGFWTKRDAVSAFTDLRVDPR